MRKALGVLMALAAPAMAFAQGGTGYHDNFGDPLLFAQVDIPVLDQHGVPLVDPATGSPVTAQYCRAVPINNIPESITKSEVSGDDTPLWLKAVSFTLDMSHHQIVIHHVWMLDTIATPQSPGYKLISSPRVIDYDVNIAQRFTTTRPMTSKCNWDQILANVVVTRETPPSGGGTTGAGGRMPQFFNCWTEFVHNWSPRNGPSTTTVRHCT
jgi:hypothetical protein